MILNFRHVMTNRCYPHLLNYFLLSCTQPFLFPPKANCCSFSPPIEMTENLLPGTELKIIPQLAKKLCQ